MPRGIKHIHRFSSTENCPSFNISLHPLFCSNPFGFPLLAFHSTNDLNFKLIIPGASPNATFSSSPLFLSSQLCRLKPWKMRVRSGFLGGKKTKLSTVALREQLSIKNFSCQKGQPHGFKGKLFADLINTINQLVCGFKKVIREKGKTIFLL